MATGVEILKEARGLIEKYGWTKGTMIKYDAKGKIGGYCSLGAILVGTKRLLCPADQDALEVEELLRYDDYAEADEKLKREIQRSFSANEIFGMPPGIVLWNDMYAKSKEEVLDMFDRAIGEPKPAQKSKRKPANAP